MSAMNRKRRKLHCRAVPAVLLAAVLMAGSLFVQPLQPVKAKTVEYEVLSHTMATEEEFNAVSNLYIPRVLNDQSESVKKVSYGSYHKTMQFQMQQWYNSSGCKLDITDAVEMIKSQTADAVDTVYVGISAEISARSSEGGFGFLYDEDISLPAVTLTSAYTTQTVELPLSELVSQGYETLYMGIYANDPSVYFRNVRVYYYIGEREQPVELTLSDSPAGAKKLILQDLGKDAPARTKFYSPYMQGAITTEEDCIRYEADGEDERNGIRMNVTSFIADQTSGCTFGASIRIKVENWSDPENADNKALMFFEVTAEDGTVKSRVILGSYEPNNSLTNLTNDTNEIGEDWSSKLLMGQSRLEFGESDTVYLCIIQKNSVQYYDETCLWCYEDNKLSAEDISVSLPFYDEENEMILFDIANLTAGDTELTILVHSYTDDESITAESGAASEPAGRTLSKIASYRLLLPAGTDKEQISIPAAVGDEISCYTADGSCYLEPYAVNAKQWIATWGSSQLTASGDTLPPSPGLEGNTYRQAVRVSVGGDFLRLTFSNEYGEKPLEIKAVHIAQLRNAGLSEIDTATDTIVTFGGNTAITIPAGETVQSDLTAFSFASLEQIAVTTEFGVVPVSITSHTASRSTNWLLEGSHVTDTDMTGAATATSWYFLSELEVLADASSRVVVCFGDSITDGYGSVTDRFSRWTDKLAEALQSNEATQEIAVVNRGIGGNSIWGGNGPSGVKRFERDVLNTAGAAYCIFLIGVNDIGYASSDTSASIIAQLTAWVKQCHENGILAYGGSILPFEGNSYYTELHDDIRKKVNSWMLSEDSPFDEVIDFAGAIANPENSSKMLAVYANDYLHPNVAGYEFMGNMIDLSLFE